MVILEFEKAFQEYNDSLHPFVEDVQAIRRRDSYFASADFEAFIDAFVLTDHP